jgi:hypothetical protein
MGMQMRNMPRKKARPIKSSIREGRSSSST